MTGNLDRGLLPAGLQDILPPYAAHESVVAQRLLASFMAHGYEQVKPPLLEFEESLFMGTGAAVASQTFRLMDPVSQHMMGLRADMTPQIARIAATRMRNAPRPLRLCYAGQALQVRGSQLRPERQFGQVGVELIGADGEAADAEVIALASEALSALGVEGLSIDLNLPPLVGKLAQEAGLSGPQGGALARALDRKDTTAVESLAGSQAQAFLGLLRAAGPVDRALEALAALPLPEVAAADIAALQRVAELLRSAQPDLILTIDPAEHRGFEYHIGISFIIFAAGIRGELGRGGRYRANGFGAQGEGEISTGFSLFMDTVLRAVPRPEPGPRVYVPANMDPALARALRDQGWITVAGLAVQSDTDAEARRLGCSYVLHGGKPVELKDE